MDGSQGWKRGRRRLGHLHPGTGEKGDAVGFTPKHRYGTGPEPELVVLRSARVAFASGGARYASACAPMYQTAKTSKIF